MNHRLSESDHYFLRTFESCELDPEDFRHREHVRLAYCVLVSVGLEEAPTRLREDLLRFVAHVGADPRMYHETLTVGWILAVHAFMGCTEPCSEWQEFIDRNPLLLDKEILYTHYSRDLMDSDRARTSFVQPDLEPIPLSEDLPARATPTRGTSGPI